MCIPGGLFGFFPLISGDLLSLRHELLRGFVSGWSCESGSWRGWLVHPRSCAGGVLGVQ